MKKGIVPSKSPVSKPPPAPKASKPGKAGKVIADRYGNLPIR